MALHVAQVLVSGPKLLVVLARVAHEAPVAGGGRRQAQVSELLARACILAPLLGSRPRAAVVVPVETDVVAPRAFDRGQLSLGLAGPLLPSIGLGPVAVLGTRSEKVGLEVDQGELVGLDLGDLAIGYGRGVLGQSVLAETDLEFVLNLLVVHRGLEPDGALSVGVRDSLEHQRDDQDTGLLLGVCQHHEVV